MTSVSPSVVLIDDDPEVLASLSQLLSLVDIPVRTFNSALDALPLLNDGFHGVVVSDIRMPGMDGMNLLQTLNTSIPVILITGHGGIAQAVEAMKLGAFDFLEKPYKPDRLVELVQRALEQTQASLAISSIAISAPADLSRILIGDTAPMVALRNQISSLARVNADVIIRGETGTGKELVARSLHDLSIRAEHPFMAVNVAAIPENLLESELFGHEAGAFTDAKNRHIGIFEAANQGTLFLDEIESMPMAFQIKLLRVLQEREVTRVGSRAPIPLNVRVISATKEDLRVAATEGRFREDLYYRLMVADIVIAPLRDRAADIPMLFQHFMQLAGEDNNIPVPALTADDLLALELHDWPGNVRELRHTAERFMLTRSYSDATVQELLQIGSSNRVSVQTGDGSLSDRLESIEKSLISAELRHHQGNIKAVMEVLDLPRRTLNQKMQKYQLKRDDYTD
ncbi:sigma-54-dependent transcriptional regulator [Reinekea blandensis]|uniref:Sigma 54-dependent transcriptional activator containing CheY-like receiver domain n=1 Tax=Reinekea blandensis MED297 TaxID=314283 RepID=A4B9M9_9GAMM|nr:sigma-54 dependent transcriptional regulator [Reinekea blandensis]EAR11330.1 sigma 54-dependent transcriptional activator containing CheY-like receiver domain [Reinekea sp. MED297] [Reinekea blandensis MED297]